MIFRSITSELVADSDYRKRRNAIRRANRENPRIRRGIALTPVKFGVSFTATHFNHASALVHVYTDGSIHLNHGGTEMGQGLFIKVAQVVAEEFRVALDTVKDNGNKHFQSSRTLRRLPPLPVRTSTEKLHRMRQERSRIACAMWLRRNGMSHLMLYISWVARYSRTDYSMSFTELVQLAHRLRVPLSATGHYRTPKISWDRTKMKGRPFFYFGTGAAVSEVAVDSLTGEYLLSRVDILHDVGKSLNPAIDMGQIEGGFVQGAGWLTSEELWWDDAGNLRTHAPSTYKIPTSGDVPEAFNVKIWERGRNTENTIYRSKAVGEPPLMLAISVYSAICDAVSSLSNYQVWPKLDAPATPERVLMAIENIRNTGSTQ